jgi:LmbE family N-acetylglucosaminyl deacetylase
MHASEAAQDERARALLGRLAAGEIIAAPVVVVSAHPDDESIGLGGRLACFDGLTLVQHTDGAPHAMEDARRAGFATRRAYADAREAEALRALAALGAHPRRRLAHGVPDQQGWRRLAEISRRLADEIAGAEAVFTHAYEGGHPDHDAAAFAVAAACAVLGRRGRPRPLRLEFAGYHQRDGRRAAGVFWPDVGAPETAVRIEREAVDRKRAALACFASQAPVIAWFSPETERYRRAPDYDFTRPPPPGAALYDSFGWAARSADWRRAAREALADLELEAPQWA